MGARENKVETYLDEQVRAFGGITRKWTSTRPVPDRIVILDGIVAFVEVKTTDGRLSGGQVREIERLSDAGGWVTVVYGHADVDQFMKKIMLKLADREVAKRKANQ